MLLTRHARLEETKCGGGGLYIGVRTVGAVARI